MWDVYKGETKSVSPRLYCDTRLTEDLPIGEIPELNVLTSEDINES